MCASNGSSTCYSNFNELFEYATNGQGCYNSLPETGTCPSECSIATAEGIDMYGCCVNAAINYLEEASDPKKEVAELFSACDVTRPPPCTDSPLSSARTQQKRDDYYDNSISLFQLHVLLVVRRLLCKIDVLCIYIHFTHHYFFL